MDMEKIVKGIECHRKKIQTTNSVSCLECPYSEPNPIREWCMSGLMDDIYAMLKEQEARVITREELQQFEGSPCWFESSGTYMGKDGFWIIPAVFRTFYAGIIMSYTSVLDGVEDYGELGLSAYNKTWRCWTTKPTTEQRQAVKWE